MKVLTAPSVISENGKQALIQVGASVPILDSVVTNNSTSTQSVTYRDTGVILNVTPTVFENSISLDVKQEISDAIQTESGVKNSPTITKNSIQTSLNLNSGDFVIIGGLNISRDSFTKDKLPYFSFLLGKQSAQSESDVVIVLQAVKLD